MRWRALTAVILLWSVAVAAMGSRYVREHLSAGTCQGYECSPLFQAFAFVWVWGVPLLLVLAALVATVLFATRKRLPQRVR